MSSHEPQKPMVAPPRAPIIRKRAPPDAELRSAAAGAPPGRRTSSVTTVYPGQNQASMFPDGILNGVEEPEAAKDDEDKMDDADDDAGSQTSGTSTFDGTRNEFDELMTELQDASPASPASPVSAGSRMSPTSPLPWTSNLAPVDTTPWAELEGYMSFPFSV